jgi:hypothetical protein
VCFGRGAGAISTVVSIKACWFVVQLEFYYKYDNILLILFPFRECAFQNVNNPGTNLEVDDSISAETLARLKNEVTLQVAGVEPREGQSVAVAGKRNCGGCGFGRLRGSRVHVVEKQIRQAAWNAASQVGHLREQNLVL